MTDLTELTIAGARDGLKAKKFSATELTDAYLKAMEAARRLNAYVAETPEQARKMAGRSDARIAAGEARPLEGIPLGIKDLFCTEGVHSQAGSHILDGFRPTYESTVTANLWNDGAVMLGKLNMDEFAMGSSNETSYYGPVVSPWRSNSNNADLVPGGSSGGSAAGGGGGGGGPRRPSRRGSAPARPRRIPAARSASRQPSPERLGSSRHTGAARAGASRRSPPRSTRRAP